MNFNILIATIMFCAGNFAFQFLFSENWGTAAERSYFQIILGLYLFFTIKKPR